MSVRSLTVGACAAIAAAQLIPPQFPCTVNFNGASYNLDPMASGSPIAVVDSRNDASPGSPVYWFIFQPCRNIYSTELPGRCPNLPVSSAPAWRVCEKNCGGLSDAQACARLSAPLTTTASLKWSPFPWDVSAGASLNYTGGDSCGQSGLNYSVHLNFQCRTTAGFAPANTEVIRDTSCRFRINYETRFACPTQCANSVYGGICNGNGVCDYDTSRSTSRCFCNLGWSGASCDVQGDKGLPPATNYAPVITGGFFGSVFGGILIAVGCLALRTKLLGGEMKDLFTVGLTGCGVGTGTIASKDSASGGSLNYAAAPVLAYEAPSAGAPAPLFSGSASGGYVPPDANDGPLLS